MHSSAHFEAGIIRSYTLMCLIFCCPNEASTLSFVDVWADGIHGALYQLKMFGWCFAIRKHLEQLYLGLYPRDGGIRKLKAAGMGVMSTVQKQLNLWISSAHPAKHAFTLGVGSDSLAVTVLLLFCYTKTFRTVVSSWLISRRV